MKQPCPDCAPVLQEAARRVFWLAQENEQLKKRNQQLAAGSAKVVDAFEVALKILIKVKTRGFLSDEEIVQVAEAIEPCAALSENLATGLAALQRRNWGKKAKPNS